MFDAAYIAKLIRETEQAKVSGDRLPSSLQPIVNACACSIGSCATAVPRLPRAPELAMVAGVGYVSGDAHAGRAVLSVPHPLEERVSFLIANMADLESLCEYRMRHPTLDLVHGEILIAGVSDAAAQADPAVAATLRKTYSPTAWKELLDDTLELMKAIAVTDPQAPTCTITVSVATLRVKNAVLLYQVACRALVRLLHSVLTVSHTFVATMQAGLQVPSRTDSPQTSSSTFSGHNYFSRDALGPIYPDYSLTPTIVHDVVRDYYHAIYQFNRTVNMLRAYCEAAEHVDKDTSKRALAAFKVLPEVAIREFKSSQKIFVHPANTAITKLHEAARQSAELKSSETTTITSFTSTEPSFSPFTFPLEGSSRIVNRTPLADDEVRESMLETHDYHASHCAYQEKVWQHQVDALCDLFDTEESEMLHQVFQAGLAGLWQQWQEFTNNGAAAAEKALGQAMDTGNFPRYSNPHPVRHNSNNGAFAPSTFDIGVAGVHQQAHRASVSNLPRRSSTYILRSLPSGVRVRASSVTKTDVISLERTSLESSTESAIDALLQEDDVVVICNEECSCNDKLKLVDRFQVLRDVLMGRGNYSTVYRAWDEVVGCYLAAKELPLDASKAHNVAVREVLQEYTVLTELSHPNIVRVVAFMVLRLTARIYMEWMPSGSLQDVLRHHPRGMLRESVVRRYARDVLSGLAFLHSRGVIHRDVKPGNMLLSSDGTVKLTDFGTSLVLSGNHRTLESSSVTGTAAYMAPECVQGTYSSASDIWSFGCSVVHLVSGTVPWCSPTTGSTWEPIALLFKIGNLDDTTHLERPHDALKAAAKDTEAALDGDFAGSTAPAAAVDVDSADATEETSKSTKGVSAELLDMLDAIFVVDRRKRPSASELLQHPFFKVK
ncbi:protein kinase [Lotmaria passim]